MARRRRPRAFSRATRSTYALGGSPGSCRSSTSTGSTSNVECRRAASSSRRRGDAEARTRRHARDRYAPGVRFETDDTDVMMGCSAVCRSSSMEPHRLTPPHARSAHAARRPADDRGEGQLRLDRSPPGPALARAATLVVVGRRHAARAARHGARGAARFAARGR